MMPPAGTASPGGYCTAFSIDVISFLLRRMLSGEEVLTPVVNYHITGSDLEWDQGSFEDEEIPACRKTERLVNVSAGKTNKWT